MRTGAACGSAFGVHLWAVSGCWLPCFAGLGRLVGVVQGCERPRKAERAWWVGIGRALVRVGWMELKSTGRSGGEGGTRGNEREREGTGGKECSRGSMGGDGTSPGCAVKPSAVKRVRASKNRVFEFYEDFSFFIINRRGHCVVISSDRREAGRNIVRVLEIVR